jgi:hypothetical protein
LWREGLLHLLGVRRDSLLLEGLPDQALAAAQDPMQGVPYLQEESEAGGTEEGARNERRVSGA